MFGGTMVFYVTSLNIYKMTLKNRWQENNVLYLLTVSQARLVVTVIAL